MPIPITTEISRKKLQEIIRYAIKNKLIPEKLACRLIHSIESIKSDGKISLDDEQLEGLIKIQEVRVNQRTTKSYYKEVALNFLGVLALAIGIFSIGALIYAALAAVVFVLETAISLLIVGTFLPISNLVICLTTLAGSAAGLLLTSAMLNIDKFFSPSPSNPTEIETLRILKDSMKAMELMDETKISPDHGQEKSESHFEIPHHSGSFFQKTTKEIDASNEQLLSKNVPPHIPSSAKI